ncbi:MAG: MaoC family dehydratase [Beijerinckiaceae bacterium]
MPDAIAIADYAARIGQEVGVSRWFVIDQKRIDAFADCTDDHQFLHVDPVRAAQTPFGGTIAHGYLSLSMLSAIAYDALPEFTHQTLAMNYGFDKIRFMTPVKAGASIRGRFTLRACEQKTVSDWLCRYTVAVDIEGAPRPALVAEWLTLHRIEMKT